MVCHICLTTDTSKRIDRLDLCVPCYDEIIKRLNEPVVEDNGETKT